MQIDMPNTSTITPDDDFTEVKECDYKGEHYSVRDNGAIMRHANNQRKRPLDGVWSVGKKNADGYMLFCGERVHIIVATAFLGEHDSKEFVVDHIDTNRCNNRVSNLRWLTKLENILLNEYTRSKVIYICGSVEAFLANPELLYGHESEDPNFVWMRSVTAEEAENTKKNLDILLANTKNTNSFGHMGEWVYRKPYEDNSWQPDFSNRDPDLSHVLNIPKQEEISIHRKEKGEKIQQMEIFRKFTDPQLPKDFSLASEIRQEEPKSFETSNRLAVQIGWSPYTKPEFPCCPTDVSDQPLQDYLDRLKVGDIFVTACYGPSHVFDFTQYKSKILVITKIQNGVKDFALTEIEWNGEVFVHTSHGTFFDENGVRAAYTQLQDKEWTGGDSADFYC